MARDVFIKATDDHKAVPPPIDIVPKTGETISPGVVGSRKALVIVSRLPGKPAGISHRLNDSPTILHILISDQSSPEGPIPGCLMAVRIDPLLVDILSIS